MYNGIKITYGTFIGRFSPPMTRVFEINEKREAKRKRGKYLSMSLKLREYLARKHEQNTLIYGNKNPLFLDFTFGVDPENHIECVSVCNPVDNFNKKDGRSRVINRIHQMRINSENFDHKKYPWIYKLE